MWKTYALFQRTYRVINMLTKEKKKQKKKNYINNYFLSLFSNATYDDRFIFRQMICFYKEIVLLMHPNFPQKCFPFNFKLADFAFNRIKLLRHGINFDTKFTCRFIYKVNCFVGQKSVGNVS